MLTNEKIIAIVYSQFEKALLVWFPAKRAGSDELIRWQRNSLN